MEQSLRASHPEARLTVLLLDADPHDVVGFQDAQLLGAAAVIGEEYGLLAAANPSGALPVAVLAQLMRLVLASGDGPAIYIGAGQRVLSSLSALVDLTEEHDVVLVARARDGAHSLLAVPEMVEGAFSRQLLGFRTGASTDALLDAWPRYFASAGDDGAGAVRAWLDGIHALVADVAVLRDRGYGLDPWSLAAAQVFDGGGDADDALQVDSAPARMIDFGALDPDAWQSWFDGPDRVALSSAPTLARLAEHHAQDLIAAGWSREAAAQERVTQLQDGLRLTETIRSLLVEAILARVVTRSPFSAAGRQQLYSYLNEPGGRGQALGITRLHMAIWERRLDLQEAYPHIEGPDGPGFTGWLCVHGSEGEGLVAELLPPAPALAYRDADPNAHEDPPRLGVNVVGFFTSELGVGEVARQLIAGLDARQIPALPIQGQLAPPSRQGVSFSYARIDDAAYPINLICINGDGIPVFTREAGRSFFAGRHTIAVWWWEVGSPPASWTGAYDSVDEVWVASDYVYDAIAPTSPVPVVKITLPLLAPEVATRTRSQLGLPEGFLFLYVHDYHSVFARKHPIGLIDAFCKAFPPGSGAKLVLKSINAATRIDEHERTMHAVAQHPDIALIDGYVSAAEKNAMIAQADCYVSLHRSEGFGLTLAEAMLMGKPVIATRFGGNLEYMDDENAYLVGYQPVAVGEGVYPYPPDGIWADPDLDQAAALMRRVFSERAEAEACGRRAQAHMLKRHSPDVAGSVIERRLRLIAERMYRDGARSLNLAHLPALAPVAAGGQVAQRPSIDWGQGAMARGERRAHRSVDAWARAFSAHEDGVESELRGMISALDARVRDIAAALQEQQNARHAETMAELRRIKAQLADSPVKDQDPGGTFE